MTFLHRLRHLFGWNTGYVYSWWEGAGRLMTGFRCHECGLIESVSVSRVGGIVGACGNTPQSKERPCTCHPDDLPPRPCPRKYAIDECRLAHVISMQGAPK